MKRYCTVCEIISQTVNNWGPCRECQPGYLSTIFDYGEFLGDLEVVRLLRVMRTAALYEARRWVDNKPKSVLLKVAHDDAADLIKREATLLAQLYESGQHPMLPVLLPAYQYADGKQRPYGKIVFQDQIKYYLVYEYQEGEFLRDMLDKNPQPWYRHAAWLTISLADVLAYVWVKGKKLVFNLSPDSVLIRIDKAGVPRPILMDLSMASEPTGIDPELVKRYVLPAYTAPELLTGRGPYSEQTDIYTLGLLLYEMLAGHPAYPYKQRRAEDVRNSVRTSYPALLNRTDLAAEVTATVVQATDKAPARRQESIRVFAKELRTKFGEVPPERRRGRIPRAVLAAGVAIIFFLVTWTVLMAALQAGA